jgi:hypothetical protein
MPGSALHFRNPIRYSLAHVAVFEGNWLQGAVIRGTLWLLIMALLVVSPAFAKEKPGSDSLSSAQHSLPSTASLYSACTKLLREYYPNAKIRQKDANLHAEYKVHMFDVPQTNTIEPGVEWGGVLCDLNLQPGPYTGVDPVPRQLNQYSTYKVMILAPYSSKYDCHLMVRLVYPFDIQPEFLERFKNLVNDFESKLFS